MKISQPTNSSKSKSFPNTEHIQAIAQSLEGITVQLKDAVRQAAQDGDSFDRIERSVRDLVARMGFQAMQLFIALQGNGDLGLATTGSNGKALKRSQFTATTIIRSVFGKHSFEEFTYAPGIKKAIELRPISARMSLPERQWSFLVQEFSQMLCVDQAYEQAMKNLEAIFGGSFALETAEQINRQLGQSAGNFMGDLPKPDPNSESKFLIASADCKGVPLVKEDAPKVLPFESTKKNPGNRRMATVTSVYSVDPHIRTAEDVTEALFRDKPTCETKRSDRPKPKNKNTTAHFPIMEDNGDGPQIPISGIIVGICWLIQQIQLRRKPGQVLIVLMDGQVSLWEQFRLHLCFGGKTVAVLDILHALSYVWKAAKLLETTDEARKKFTRERLLRILHGEVKSVINGFRRLATTRGLPVSSRNEMEDICAYLENNADRMKYDEYLRRGYPIASGVIEGACRHLVKDRMERSGMRWTLEGARSMLNLRAVFQSDHWAAFLKQNMDEETRRVHSHREVLKEYEPLNLAC